MTLSGICDFIIPTVCYCVISFPAWVQPASEAVLAVVTSATLIVLIKYAVDTNKIAKNSTQQLENSRMPFIALVMKKDDERYSGWAIKNLGFGTAINIYYTRCLPDRKPMMQWMTPLAPGEDYPLPRENDIQMAKSGFRVEYESLSGIKYRTAVEWVNGDPNTKFYRLT